VGTFPARYIFEMLVDSSIPPLRDQAAALIRRNLELLDRLLDRGLLVWLVIDDAHELGRRPADVVDGPGEVLLFGPALGHREEL
jgi:hypothetical protein